MSSTRGADISLGGEEFLLSRNQGKPALTHGSRPRLAQKVNTGGTGDDLLGQNALSARYTDFSGGEGVKYATDAAPSSYDFGTANGRVAGILQGPPEVTESSVTFTDEFTSNAYLTQAFGSLCLGSDQDLWYTQDGNSWTEVDGGSGVGAGYEITAMAGDAERCWVATFNYDSGSDTRRVSYFDTSGATLYSENQSSANPFTDIALLGPDMVLWGGGGAVYTLDITNSPTEAFGSSIYDAGVQLTNVSGHGMCATDSSVAFMYSYVGKTAVFNATKSGSNWTVTPIAADLWPGFTARAMCHHMGILFIAGSDEGTLKRNRLLGIPMNDTTQLIEFKQIRPEQSYTVVNMRAGLGPTILIGMESGEVFVYDISKDAYSLLDTHPGYGLLQQVASYRDLRFGVTRNTASSRWDIAAWAHDEDDTSRTGYVVLPSATLNIPETSKILVGLHTTVRPFLASETVNIKYDINEAAWRDTSFFTDAGTITAADLTLPDRGSGASGYAFLAVSTNQATTKSGRTIRPMATVTDNAKMLSLVAEVAVVEYEEVWQLTIDLRDEQPNKHIAHRQAKAEVLEDLLWNETTGIITNRSVVEFIDYTQDTNDPKTYSVVVESVGGDDLVQSTRLVRSSNAQLTLRRVL